MYRISSLWSSIFVAAFPPRLTWVDWPLESDAAARRNAWMRNWLAPWRRNAAAETLHVSLDAGSATAKAPEPRLANSALYGLLLASGSWVVTPAAMLCFLDGWPHSRSGSVASRSFAPPTPMRMLPPGPVVA